MMSARGVAAVARHTAIETNLLAGDAMKLYLISLAAGVLVGLVYALLGVRSPAPPVVALIGLAGILIGEQFIPWVKDLIDAASYSTITVSAREFERHPPTSPDPSDSANNT